jgi:hypothetical protein
LKSAAHRGEAIDAITVKRMLEISKKTFGDGGYSDEDRWFEIWRELFPDEKLPESACEYRFSMLKLLLC